MANKRNVTARQLVEDYLEHLTRDATRTRHHLNQLLAMFGGWQAHSARAAVTRLRRAGLRITPVKLEGQAAYRLETSRTPAAPVAQETLWTGISESVITFYRRRAAVLAAAV